MKDYVRWIQEAETKLLLLCLCGNKAELIQSVMGSYGYYPDEYRIECTSCTLRTRDDTDKDRLIKDWNTRL